MGRQEEISDYVYESATLNYSHSFLLPTVRKIVLGLGLEEERRRLFDLGCGNGSVGNEFHKLGFDVTGVDPSSQGVTLAKAHYPHLKIAQGSAYDELAATYGQFPVVTSLEVVEHTYFPHKYASTLFSLVQPGGVAVVSTPYHGYLKNLALALSGAMDQHFSPLWDHGHIKFWSRATLGSLLKQAGFSDVVFRRVGRIPALAKSLIAVARRDGTPS